MRRFFLSLFLAAVLISQDIFLGFYEIIASTLCDLGLKKIFYIFAFFADWNIFLLISIIVQ